MKTYTKVEQNWFYDATLSLLQVGWQSINNTLIFTDLPVIFQKKLLIQGLKVFPRKNN